MIFKIVQNFFFFLKRKINPSCKNLKPILIHIGSLLLRLIERWLNLTIYQLKQSNYKHKDLGFEKKIKAIIIDCVGKSTYVTNTSQNLECLLIDE